MNIRRINIRFEIFRLRKKHHAMRIKFIEDDNATESDAVNVMVKDMKIRSQILSLKEDLKILIAKQSNY